jgi:hypothetical protein
LSADSHFRPSKVGESVRFVLPAAREAGCTSKRMDELEALLDSMQEDDFEG